MEEVESLNEVRAINAVLKNEDKNALFGPSVDDLFTSFGDVWSHIKEYHDRYGVIPSFELVQDQFPELDDVAVKGKTDYYVDALRKEYIENRVQNILVKAGSALSGGASANEVKDRLQEALGKLDRFQSTARDLNVMDMADAKRRYDEVRERAIQMGGTPGVPTGLDFIDACMPLGMQPGDVISIIGYPARGKSALGGALFPAKAIKRGYKPLIFTREMSAEAVQDRIFTVMGSGLFSNTDLMLGNINTDDFRSFSEKNKGEGWIVDGNGSGEMTPNFMRGKIDQHRPDFVVLDYLQLFSDNRLTEDMTGRMRNLSLEIKALANYCQIPIIVISSATPPDGGKVDSPPNVERSAWSRQLAYDSTVCIAVHRHDDTNLYQIECAKNRYGPLFSGFLDWDMDRGTYEEKFELE